MSIQTPDSFETSLRSGRFHPVYLLFGDEEFLIDEGLDRLLELAVDESTRSFNFDQFSGGDVQLRDIVERSMAYPMMAERRVVVVRDIDRAIGNRKSDDVSMFRQYLENPAETTILILTINSSSVLTRNRLKNPYDAIPDHGMAVQYKKIYDRELGSWATRRIASKGKKISPEGVELFVNYVGANLRTMENEIEKLFTFVEGRSNITDDDVRSVVGASKSWNVFELQKAIGERKLDLALEIADRMMQAGEPVQVVLTMLSRYFTILWRLVEIQPRQRDRQAMAREVGISPFFIGEYSAALSQYGLAGIRNAFEALLSADIELKTSRTSVELVMQLLIMSIINGSNQLGLVISGEQDLLHSH